MEYSGFVEGDISKVGEKSVESDRLPQTQKSSQTVLVWSSEHEMIKNGAGGECAAR